MTIHVLISGELHRDPIQRTAQTGRTFTTANVRVQDGSETQWASLIVFSEDAQQELMRCHAGDAVSVQGKLKVSVFEKAGEYRPALDIVASGILPLRPKPRERKPRQHRTDGREYDARDAYRRPAPTNDFDPDLNDPCPI